MGKVLKSFRDILRDGSKDMMEILDSYVSTEQGGIVQNMLVGVRDAPLAQKSSSSRDALSKYGNGDLQSLQNIVEPYHTPIIQTAVPTSYAAVAIIGPTWDITASKDEDTVQAKPPEQPTDPKGFV